MAATAAAPAPLSGAAAPTSSASGPAPVVPKYDLFVKYPDKAAQVCRRIDVFSLEKLREQLKVLNGQEVLALHPRLHQHFMLEDVRQLSDGMRLDIVDSALAHQLLPRAPSPPPSPPHPAVVVAATANSSPQADPPASLINGFLSDLPHTPHSLMGESALDIDSPSRSSHSHLQLIHTYKCDDSVSAVVVCGDRVVSGHADSTLRVWDLAADATPFFLSEHNDAITVMHADPSNSMAFSGSADNTIKVWSLGDMRCVSTLVGHRGPITAIAYSPESCLLYTGSEDSTIKLWDLRTHQCHLTLAGHAKPTTNTASYAHNNSMSTFAGSNNNSSTGNPLPAVVSQLQQPANVTSLMVVEKMLLSGGSDCAIKVWDLRNMRFKLTLTPQHAQPITAMCRTGRYFYSVSKDRNIREWDCKILTSSRYMCAHNSGITRALPFQDCLVTAAEDGVVKLWDVKSFWCNTTLVAHEGPVNALSTAGRMLITGGSDGLVKVWNLQQD